MQKNWFTIFSVKVTARSPYDPNMTISTISSKLLVCLQAKLGLIVQHHKLECPVENLDYFIQGQGHNKGSECQ